MATKTVTIDTGEWLYPDVYGVNHEVTNAETFTFELTDGGASAVKWQQDHAKSVATTDGLRITMRPQSEGNLGGSAGTNVGARRSWGATADSEQGSAIYNKAGELVCECPVSGVTQYWKAQKFNVDDSDTPTSLTATFEDQFGHTFTWTTVTIS